MSKFKLTNTLIIVVFTAIFIFAASQSGNRGIFLDTYTNSQDCQGNRTRYLGLDKPVCATACSSDFKFTVVMNAEATCSEESNGFTCNELACGNGGDNNSTEEIWLSCVTSKTCCYQGTVFSGTSCCAAYGGSTGEIFTSESSCQATTNLCGNGVTNTGEDCSSCPADIKCATGQYCSAGGICKADSTDPCGNGQKESGETCSSCPEDIACTSGNYCQNGVCISIVQTSKLVPAVKISDLKEMTTKDMNLYACSATADCEEGDCKPLSYLREKKYIEESQVTQFFDDWKLRAPTAAVTGVLGAAGGTAACSAILGVFGLATGGAAWVALPVCGIAGGAAGASVGDGALDVLKGIFQQDDTKVGLCVTGSGSFLDKLPMLIADPTLNLIVWLFIATIFFMLLSNMFR